MKSAGVWIGLGVMAVAGYFLTPRLSVAGPAPDFMLMPGGGRPPVTLREMQGRVVVLDFSATWFAPCRTAIQAMQQIHEEFGRRGVVVLGISVDEKGDPHEAMRELGATFPMLLDGQTAASEYGVEALPTIVVVDREGRIVLRESGWSSLSAENVRDAVREALEE